VSGSEHSFIIENLNDGPYRNAQMADAYRKYRGLEFLFNKRFSNKWQLMMSYIYSKTSGTIDNGWGDDIGWAAGTARKRATRTSGSTPTATPLSTQPICSRSKAATSCRSTSASTPISGDHRHGLGPKIPDLTLQSGADHVFHRAPGQQPYGHAEHPRPSAGEDLHPATKYRLGVMLDCFNVFNANTITSWGTRYNYDWLLPDDPDYTPSTEGHESPGNRQTRGSFRLGIRLIF